jgi:predicted acylesterase/phospholipase RssA
LAPVEIDGKLLVDGGIANNLPINEARKLCADVVIAVNISTPPLKRSEITSRLSVAGQLVNFLGKQTVDEQLKSLTSRDVLIAPELGRHQREQVRPLEGRGQDRRGRDAGGLPVRSRATACRLTSTPPSVRGRSPRRSRPRRLNPSASRD